MSSAKYPVEIPSEEHFCRKQTKPHMPSIFDKAVETLCLCKVYSYRLHAKDPVILSGSYVYSATNTLDTVAFIYCVELCTTCHYLKLSANYYGLPTTVQLRAAHESRCSLFGVSQSTAQVLYCACLERYIYETVQSSLCRETFTGK